MALDGGHGKGLGGRGLQHWHGMLVNFRPPPALPSTNPTLQAFVMPLSPPGNGLFDTYQGVKQAHPLYETLGYKKIFCLFFKFKNVFHFFTSRSLSSRTARVNLSLGKM